MLYVVFADEDGLAYDDDRYLAVARTGNQVVEVSEDEYVPLPAGASLTILPDRVPIGLTKDKQEFTAVNDVGFAVAALLPQGYTRTYLPAYVPTKEAGQLALFGYTAVAWHDQEERFYVAAVATDDDIYKWSPAYYNTQNLSRLVEAKQQVFHNNGVIDNRIINQLAKCALEYGCFTAQNIFYERWEGGVPVSPSCNANCIGCISKQESECCPSPQERIDYVPSKQEVAEVMLSHLQSSEEAIISFGQGCEGEPLLQADLIVDAIKDVRARCSQGTINANTNAGNTRGVEQVCQAGIDSLRVSIISALDKHYEAYYRPVGYSLKDVTRSIKLAKEHNVFVALNLLTLPGVTDTSTELEALIDFVKATGVDMIQFRNLNLDPDQYQDIWPAAFKEEAVGVIRMLEILKEEVPEVELGSFSKPLAPK